MKKRKRLEPDVGGKPTKSIKEGATCTKEEKQTSGAETSEFVCRVQSLLRTQQTRLSGLTKLRNALKESHNPELFHGFLKAGAECQEVFKILEGGRHNLSQLEIQMCLEVLQGILLLIAEENQPNVRSGVPIVQRILQNHMKLIYSCLNPGGPPENTKAVLKLLTAMVTQGTSAAREVQRTFDFTLKPLQSIANRRDVKADQDIRTCFIYFCLSFLVFGDLTVMKQILELKGFLQSVIKGLKSDSPTVVLAVLSTLKGRVVQNAGITKKTKVQFFNAFVLSQVATLYQYSKDIEQERDNGGSSSDQTVRQQVHEFLLEICTSFKLGICFFNKTGGFATRSNNPVLLRFLQNVISTATSDTLVQELVIRTLHCCQDLVTPFLSSLTLTYEPRLSMPWIANMNLMTKIYLRLPQTSQMLDKFGVELTAKMIPSLINMVVPVGVGRTVLSHGVQHASSLVKHTTLSLLVVILDRAHDAAVWLASKTEPTLEHQHTTLGTQAPLLQHFREEVLKVLPDVKTVISLRQNLVSSRTVESSQEEEVVSTTILLAQSLKVIHGFQKLWPPILSHASFDLGKLLPGQHEMSDRIFPPIVQQLTLQILLQAPAGSLKWYQQKGKSGTSFVYSVLNLCGSANNENISKAAKQLLLKLLCETGLVAGDTSEVDIWLSHLSSCLKHNADRETLQKFLDEVFTAVAAEPYVYTDIVVDLQAEAMALEANAGQFDASSSHCDRSSDRSLPVSPLLVRALVQYSEMVSTSVGSEDEAAMRSFGCIAHYMNLVVCDMLHSLINPTVLCLAVLRYYGNAVVPIDWSKQRSTHTALLKYVKWWFAQVGEVADLQEYAHNDKNLEALRDFLSRSAVSCDQGFSEKRRAFKEFHRLLEPLDELELRTVMDDCMDFCRYILTGDFSPLVHLLHVKCFNITGSTSLENLAPLLQSLPFGTLLWQLLGPSVQDVNAEIPVTLPTNTPALEEENTSPCQNTWIHNLVLPALEKEPLSKTVPLCFHVLLHVRRLTTKLSSTQGSVGQEKVQSAVMLCFQLLQFLLERLVPQRSKEDNSQTIPLETVSTERGADSSSGPFCRGSGDNSQKNLCDASVMCCTVLHHPVILQCFLWKPDSSKGQVSCDLGLQLTYSVANLLLAVVPGLSVAQKKGLLEPFMDKLCEVGRMEIEAVQKENALQSSQVLYLLGLFHEYCNRDSLMEFISSLAHLPSSLLVTTDPLSNQRTPSEFLHTLLLLLDGGFHVTTDKLPLQISNEPHSDLKSNTEEQISLQSFQRLVEISQDVNCPQLDSTILKLLKTSLVFVLASTASFLDSCLDHPTKVKVSIATTLIVRSAALRSNFELRCIGGLNKKTVQVDGVEGSSDPIAFKDHLVEYVPLVCSYLVCLQGLDGETRDNPRRHTVASRLFESYWTTLWQWLLGERGTMFDHSEGSCVELLVALIHACPMQRGGTLTQAFDDLLLVASSWNSCQQRVCRELLSCLCRDCTSEQRSDLASRFCFACMESISHALTTQGNEGHYPCNLEDSLYHLVSVCKNGTAISTDVEDCATTWEIFVTNILRYKFASVKVQRTLVLLVKALYKQVTSTVSPPDGLVPLETLYEMILSHSQFLDVMLGNEQTGKSDLKGALVELMIAIVELRGDCCKTAHLPALFAAYSASLSVTDQSILYLLQLYEKHHTSFRNNRPFLWGPAAVSHHQTIKGLGPSLWQQPSVSEVLELVDVSRMNQSAVLFPQSRSLQPEIQRELTCGKDIYDPCFLLPLFSCLLAPNYEVDCRKFVERGCLSFSVASLASRAVHVRQAGCHVLARFMTHLEGAKFKERKQILHLLNCFRSGITEQNARLSSVMVCFLGRAAHILLRPEHSLYVMVNSFLLGRPALDIRDVPLFYSMFNSSSMQHVSERSWMLQLLVDGMKDSPDYYLYKRRHVIELALSYHDSPVSDQHSQNLVRQMLLSALKIHPAAYDLVKNYGVVAWIHSLCLRSPGRQSTSLNLLHTLWFTLHRRKPEASDRVPEDGPPNADGERQVRLPPNVAQECALVCWSLLDQLRLPCPYVNDTFLYLQLLASIITFLAANEQPCSLSCDRVVSLICLWCETFDETVALNRLLSSLNLSKVVSGGQRTGVESGFDQIGLKTESLSSLLVALTSWEPPTGTGTNCVSPQQTILVVWRFGLHCFSTRKLRHDPSSTSDKATSFSLLTLLQWFRSCVVKDCSLQDSLVTRDPMTDVRQIVELYRVDWANTDPVLLGKDPVLLEREPVLLERDPVLLGKDPVLLEREPVLLSRDPVLLESSRQEKPCLRIAKEVNVICLVLLTAVQRVKKGANDEAGLPPVCGLVSQEPYSKIITEGMEKVIFPVFPYPHGEQAEESCVEQGAILQQLVSLFMQELWFGQLVPVHFLSLLLSESDNAHETVELLIEALGGKEVIAKWISEISHNACVTQR